MDTKQKEKAAELEASRQPDSGQAANQGSNCHPPLSQNKDGQGVAHPEQSEKFLLAAMESIDEGLLVVSKARRVLHYNTRFLEIWSIPAELAALKDDQAFLHYVMPQVVNPARLISQVQQIYQCSDKTDDLVHFKDGRIIAVSSYPVLQHREEIGRVWIFRDVTAKKQTEDRLAQLAKEQRAILEALQIGLCLVKDRRLQWTNPAFLKIFGCEDKDIHGVETSVFYASMEDFGRIGEGYSQLAKGQVYLTEALMKKKDGAHFWCAIWGQAINPANSEEGSIWALADITDLKRTEEELRHEKIFSEAVLNAMPGLLFLYDDENKLVRWNKQHESITGYSAEELKGMDLRDWHQSAEEKEYCLAEVQKAKALGYGSTEAELMMKGGKRVPFFFTAASVEIDCQKYLLGIGLDITQRKLAEEALRKSQAALETAQAMAHIGSWELDPATGVGSWSKEMFRLWRRDPEKGIPSFHDFLEPVFSGDRNKLLSAQERAIKTDVLINFEFRANPGGGPERYFTATMNAIKEPAGRLLCLSGTLQDITGRKRVEQELREREERFKRLVQNSNDIIWIVDADGCFTSVSGPVERILGYQPEELMGKAGIDFMHPDDQLLSKATMAEALARPGQPQIAEFRFRHKNGNWVFLEAAGTNMLHDPVVNGVVMNIRNIAERKVAEQEKAKLQEQLQQAMKMEAIGRLAGGIAHDFNNLLTAITGNVELARLDLLPSDPLSSHLEEIQKAADSAVSLTRRLLAFSRRQIIDPKIVNLNDLIETLQKMLARLIGEDVELRTRLSADLGSTRVDPGQFEQVLINLAVNARDAMPNGGKLLIETGNMNLDEGYTSRHSHVSPGKYVLLAISDTGQGMSEEVQKHLFEPFFTTKPKGRGTGLGLATIFGAVKQARGYIEVYSEPGMGTTFKIYLPRIEKETEKISKEKRPLVLARASETALIVEDENSVCELATIMLKRLGYKVLHASNGGEAFLLAEKHQGKIDLLMTDVVMPGMNGRELAERLLKLQPGMRVLYTSGYTENVIVHHGVIEGGLQFIAKPYSLNALAQKIREILDK